MADMNRKNDKKQSWLIFIIVTVSLIFAAVAVMVMLKKILKRYVTLSIDSDGYGCGCDGKYFTDAEKSGAGCDGETRDNEAYIFEERDTDAI